jgi:hypothetical protein
MDITKACHKTDKQNHGYLGDIETIIHELPSYVQSRFPIE